MVFSDLNQAQKASLLDYLLLNQRDTGLTAESYTTMRIRVDKFLPGIEVITPTLSVFDNNGNIIPPNLIDSSNLTLTMGCCPYYNVWEMKGTLSSSVNIGNPKFRLTPIEGIAINPGISVDNINIEYGASGANMTVDKSHGYVTHTNNGPIVSVTNDNYGKIHGYMTANEPYEILCGPNIANIEYPSFIAWTGFSGNPNVLKGVTGLTSLTRLEFIPEEDCEFYAVSKGCDIAFPEAKLQTAATSSPCWYSFLNNNGITIETNTPVVMYRNNSWVFNARGATFTTNIINY